MGLGVRERDFGIGAPAPFVFGRKFLTRQIGPTHCGRMFWNLLGGCLPIFFFSLALLPRVFYPFQIMPPLSQTPVLWAGSLYNSGTIFKKINLHRITNFEEKVRAGARGVL